MWRLATPTLAIEADGEPWVSADAMAGRTAAPVLARLSTTAPSAVRAEFGLKGDLL